MNKKKLFIPIVLLAIGLSSCNKDTSIDQTIYFVSPKGKITLAFSSYLNANNYSIVKNNSLANIELNRNKKDIVICDIAVGANNIINNSLNYALTRVVTISDALLVKTNSEINDNITNDSNIALYGKGLTNDLVINKLFEEYYQINPNITYLDTEDELILHSDEYQYAIINESTYIENSDKFIVIDSLNNIWSKYTGSIDESKKQNYFPQYGIFVNKDIVENKKVGLDGFYADLNLSINNAILHEDKIVTIMSAYSKEGEQQKSFFEMTSTTFKQLQSNKQNKLGYVVENQIEDLKQYMNSFLNIINAEEKDYSTLYLS